MGRGLFVLLSIQIEPFTVTLAGEYDHLPLRAGGVGVESAGVSRRHPAVALESDKQDGAGIDGFHRLFQIELTGFEMGAPGDPPGDFIDKRKAGQGREPQPASRSDLAEQKKMVSEHL